MTKQKGFKEKGKIRFSKYFQELKKGDKVSISKECSVASSFPSRIEGKTGEVEEMRGTCAVVKANDYEKEKRYIIHPIHLRKVKEADKN